MRNFTNSGRRKVPNRNFYVSVEPEMILLENVLKSAELSRPQLVDIGILIGTDLQPKRVYADRPQDRPKDDQKTF